MLFIIINTQYILHISTSPKYIRSSKSINFLWNDLSFFSHLILHIPTIYLSPLSRPTIYTHLSFHLSINKSIHPIIHLSINLHIYSIEIYSNIYIFSLFYHQPFHIVIHIHLSIYISIHLYVYLSGSPSIWLSSICSKSIYQFTYY